MGTKAAIPGKFRALRLAMGMTVGEVQRALVGMGLNAPEHSVRAWEKHRVPTVPAFLGLVEVLMPKYADMARALRAEFCSET